MAGLSVRDMAAHNKFRLPDLAGKWVGTFSRRGTGILPVLLEIRHGRDAHATNHVPSHFPRIIDNSSVEIRKSEVRRILEGICVGDSRQRVLHG